MNVYVKRIRIDELGGRWLAPLIRLERGKRICLDTFRYVRRIR